MFLDPISLQLALGAMKAAYGGIQYCCEALSEGKIEIERVKKTVESGVKDAQTIYKEVTGLWSWLQGLLGVQKPKQTPQPTLQSAAAPQISDSSAKTKKDEYVDHVPDEDEIVQKFVDCVSDWFKNYHLISLHLEQAHKEAYAKDVLDPTEILRLTALQTKVDGGYLQLSDLMTKAPRQLGPLWSNFKAMREKVKDEQAKRRNRERIRALQDAAIAQEIKDQRLYRNLTIFYTLLIISYFWWFIWALWQNSSHQTTR